MEVEDMFKTLNDTQKEAVTAPVGPLLVIAGAGSGKTKVLVHRIAYLITQGTVPSSILALTFTNKAAGEMKERVQRLLSDFKYSANGRHAFEEQNTRAPWIGTFHALGVYILRRDGHHIGIPRSFTILDEDDAVSIVKRIVKEHELDPKQFQPTRMRHIISILKNMPFSGKEPGEDETSYPQAVMRIQEAYEKELQKAHALDFDDLLIKTVALFQEYPAVLETWRSRWHHLLVDEYQDTNTIQYTLSKLLAAESIMVVGDADQAIYSWRGANVRNILVFEKDWPGTRVITLEQNYRSTKIILEAANAIIQKNIERKEKNLWTSREEGTPICVSVAENEQEEARFVVEEIATLQKNGTQLRDTAVLYRTNAQSRALEEAFMRRGMSYRLIGGVRFYERREIKDILAYLRLSVNKHDHVSIRRVINVPTRGIGKVLIEKYFSGRPRSPREETRLASFWQVQNNLAEAYKTKTPSELVFHAIEKSGYERHIRDGTPEGEDRWANVRELRSVAAAYDHLPPPEGTNRFLEEAALLSDADLVDTSTDAVHIMTIHAAKGLEFETVFVTGLEEGIFPHSLSITDPSQMEEERRLCYVALTRAKTNLYVSTTLVRTIYGEKVWNEPSRFLRDIPAHLIQSVEKQTFETNYLETDDIVNYG